MSTLAPDPTIQRLDALRHANEVRMWRADLKRDIAACRTSVAAVLEDPPEWVGSMWTVDLLCAAPRWGRSRAHAALRLAGVSPRTRVGELTERQTRVLVAALERRPVR